MYFLLIRIWVLKLKISGVIKLYFINIILRNEKPKMLLNKYDFILVYDKIGKIGLFICKI